LPPKIQNLSNYYESVEKPYRRDTENTEINTEILFLVGAFGTCPDLSGRTLCFSLRLCGSYFYSPQRAQRTQRKP